MAADKQAQRAGAVVTEQESADLLDQVIAATRPQDDAEAARARDYFQQFLKQVVKPGQVVSKEVEQTINYWISELDAKMSEQLDEILHHPEVQRLEGTWRGLHYLVHQSET